VTPGDEARSRAVQRLLNGRVGYESPTNVMNRDYRGDIASPR